MDEKIQKAVDSYIAQPDKLKFIKDIQDASFTSANKHLIEHCFRCAIADHMQKKLDVSGVKKIVDAAITAVQDEICPTTVPANLLSDAFDLLRVDQCEELFEYLEDQIGLWKSEQYFNSTKNIILRMCNDLLRRLSKSEKNVFCGRILLFLARFFPLSEKSGLNIVGEFNLDNVTTYADVEDEELLGGPAGEMLNTEAKNVKGSVYKRFWALQDFFRNPVQCYTPDGWKTFSENATEVFSVLSSFRIEEAANRNRKRPASDTMDTDGDSFDFLHSGKYLTKQELFDLELNDPKFRKNVLLQFLILFQYLRTPTKFKTNAHTLKEDQLAFVKESTEKVHKLIEETPPEGKQFLETVEHILKREELWNRWKNEGCPQFEKPKQTKSEDGTPPLKRQKKIGTAEAVRQAVKSGRTVIGNDALTELWNLNVDNRAAFAAKGRESLPQLDEFFSEAIKQLNLPATAPNKKINDGNFIWRALRLLRIRHPQIFQGNAQIPSTLPEYIELFVKKLAREAQKDSQVAAAPVKQEQVEEQEVEDGGEEMKDEASNGGVEDEQVPRSAVTMCTSEHMKLLAPRIAKDWKKVAGRLNLTPDVVEYLETKYEGLQTQAYEMLIRWMEQEEEDATAESLIYEIGGAGLTIKVSDIFPDAQS